EAVALFQKVLEKDPRNSRAYFYLGLIDKQVGKLAEAVKNLQEALRLKPPVLEAYAELIDVFHNLGQFKEARKWVIKAEQAGSEPAKIAFLKGLIALGEDKSWEAVPSFNKAKEIDPSLTQAADFQIAMAQAKGRRLIEARDSLKAVLSKDPNSELAAVAREYERAIGKALAEYRAWRFTVGMGVQYDTNVVLKPSNDVQGVMISNDNDGSITNSFKVDYTPLLKGPWFLNGQYSFNSNTYFTIRNYNMMVQSVSLNPGYNLKNDSFSLPMNYSHVWLKEVPYQGIGTIKPTLTLLPFPNMVNQISLGYGKRNMQQAVSNPDEERSGNVYSGMVNAFQTFAEGRGMISFKYELSKDLTDGRNWENLGNRFTLMLLYPLAQKFYLILSGDLTYQEYDQNHSVFRVKRSDKLYSGSAMLSWELLPQMTMNLQYTFTKANSNIPIYDYARNLSSLECEYRF
ncbi:MAG: hypothetical protein C0407_11915, partial [Desulfobacca sp.]|nr:hypothetical protein [Desulfobacca sp.]